MAVEELSRVEYLVSWGEGNCGLERWDCVLCQRDRKLLLAKKPSK